MRIAISQINPVVGDLVGNSARILRDARRAAEEGAELIVFPELALLGYPPKDLLDRPSFVQAQLDALEALAAALPPALEVLLGFVDRPSEAPGAPLRNAAAQLRGGAIVAIVHKQLLPTYDVFEEDRYFEPGPRAELLSIAGRRIGVSICEDVWNHVPTPLSPRPYPIDPVRDAVEAGAELLVNLAASPFTLPKRAARPAMLQQIAAANRTPLLFVNQVGGNDDLLFDGASMLIDEAGEIRARLASCREDFAIVRLGESGPLRPEAPSDAIAALDALAMGVRDYVEKCGLPGVLLGLSGGIDSALTAAIAVRGLGKARVLGIALPTRYSSGHSLEDARALAAALEIELLEIPIEGIFEAYLEHLDPHLKALGAPPEPDVTFENVQARIRCATLMALANRTGKLLLNTGNKSEVAVGYCTLYGDMGGGLAVISDLPKMQVYALSNALNEEAGASIIPQRTIDKAPSAELRPDQRDSDSLPDYPLLDAVLERLIERGESIAEVIAAGYAAEEVEAIARLVRLAEHKRRQMPPGLILSSKAFGPGRRYPIAQRWRG
ncbi:MAG: NAD+ synthase [Myxococcales bacterium]|nr:NAD+ synthase [Myxococcales bacterium]